MAKQHIEAYATSTAKLSQRKPKFVPRMMLEKGMAKSKYLLAPLGIP